MKGYGWHYAMMAAGMMILAIIVIVCREVRENKQRTGSWPTLGQFIGIEEGPAKPTRPN